jgi:hypothetical protein
LFLWFPFTEFSSQIISFLRIIKGSEVPEPRSSHLETLRRTL